MPQEDYKNKKLIPILDEALDFYKELMSRKTNAEKKLKFIEKTKQKLIESKKLAGDTVTVDDEGKEIVLFKTIMCPLGDSCSKVKKARWPNSSIKSVTNFGALCPYAHHLMELEFPETI